MKEYSKNSDADKKSLNDNVVQQKTNLNAGFEDNSDEAIQMRAYQSNIQLKDQEEAAKDPQVEAKDKAQQTGLPDALKSGIEQLSGYSLDDVKVHYNSSKPAELGAFAYAQGTDIFIGPGQEQHLAHEAWHVVQQKEGRVATTTQMKGEIYINDDKGLEKEADVMGAKAVQKKANPTLANKNKSNLGSDNSIQLRSKNPYNPQTQITSHHIIPHELLMKILDKFKSQDASEDQSAAIMRSFLPSFQDLTLATFVAQVSVGIEYDGVGFNKVTEMPEAIAHKKFSTFSSEEQAKAVFKVEGAGSIDFNQFNELYSKLLNGESIEIDLNNGEGNQQVDGLRNLGESFYEWQSGNLFYGPDRIEPGAKNGFDYDASRIYGNAHVNQLKSIYDTLRSLESSNDAASKEAMKAALESLSALSKGVVIPRNDSSIWINMDSPAKKMIHDTLLPERNQTTKEGASIHKEVLSEAIISYCNQSKAHDLLTYIGRTAPHNADGTSSTDTLFEAKKLNLFLKEFSGHKANLTSPVKLDSIKTEMIALLKQLYGI